MYAPNKGCSLVLYVFGHVVIVKKVGIRSVCSPGGVLRFAVIRGRADFQGRLFDPKYFRQGANLSLNKFWAKKIF